ncbi:MAG: aldehyde dehydrogenase family protein [Pseudonocardia sp.]|nr:aldehyde dehydrogenase family protein [Pseudonocardia sp.]
MPTSTPVAQQVVTGFTANSGQYCDAGSRLLVERAVQAELVERIVARTAALGMGPGIDDRVLPFDDEDQAIELADATDYGLGAGIHTRDIDRALRVADRVDAGYIMINEYFAGGPAVPFGGTKLSGTGRERGLIAVDSYLTLKTVVARVGPAG